jgi:hypothetical protein
MTIQKPNKKREALIDRIRRNARNYQAVTSFNYGYFN